MKKAILWILLIIILAVGSFLTYLQMAFPKAGEIPKFTITSSPEKIERGKYLATHVAVCIDCHSTRDWNLYSGPIVPGTEGKGGELFDEQLGFPGKIYARNITPEGLGKISDSELLYIISTGVRQGNRAMFPVMPYPNYGTLDIEDVNDLMAYIRTLTPVKNEVQESRLNFPMNLIVRTIPKPAQFTKRPNPSDSLAYGKYLITMASCSECHTQAVKGEKLPGMDYAGGFVFTTPWGKVHSANITPDEETGIGAWTRAQFIAKFKTFDNEKAKNIPMKPPYSEAYFNTIMPWTMYAGMTEQDIGAIYTYLKTVKPVKNKVTKFAAN